MFFTRVIDIVGPDCAMRANWLHFSTFAAENIVLADLVALITHSLPTAHDTEKLLHDAMSATCWS